MIENERSHIRHRCNAAHVLGSGMRDYMGLSCPPVGATAILRRLANENPSIANKITRALRHPAPWQAAAQKAH
jgi:hypothetical protein